MYTNNVKRNKKLSLGTIIPLMLAFIMLISIQNVYAESDILGIETNVGETIDISVEEITTESPVDTEIDSNKNTIADTNNDILSPERKIAQDLEAKRQQEIEEQKRLEAIEMMTARSSRDVQYYEINVYTDLSIMTTIDADQMNEIINYWGSRRGGNMPFYGQGQIFIDAAKQSGLDPVYILAHAAVESGWGTSDYAMYHYNYFGIGAFDSNPDNATNYANNGMANGIIEGAKWIANNFYSVGQTSLYGMRYSNSGSHDYCSSTTWAYNIADIMTTSYSIIQS